MDLITAQESKLDVLINNAGAIGPYTSDDQAQSIGQGLGDSLFSGQSFEEWQDLLRTNTTTP
ncbi:hypothetical protein C8J56DRAFT_1162278 [Mycena floridula]|nr:hypothetical protein C8J56DRAFT_1162278 [Mycena floridula]